MKAIARLPEHESMVMALEATAARMREQGYKKFDVPGPSNMRYQQNLFLDAAGVGPSGPPERIERTIPSRLIGRFVV